MNLNEEEESEESLPFLKDSIALTDMKHILKDFDVKNLHIFISRLLKSVNNEMGSHENIDQNLSILKLRGKILTIISPLVEIYVKFFEYFVVLSVSSLRTISKLLYIVLGLFSQLCQNGFCLPQELSDEIENNQSGTQLKNVEDGGFGEGDGTKDVSDKVESEDQLEDALKDGVKQEKSEENDDKNIDEEENGVEMENDFDGEAYSPSAKEEDDSDKQDSDEDGSDEDLEDQMGDVDNNSDVLDEKIWGSDDDVESEDENEDVDDSGFAGKDSTDSKLVADEDNRGLKNDKDKDNDEKSEKDDNENDFDINEAENELQNDEYKDERIDPYKQNDNLNEKSVEDLPEKMELDDDKDENDENFEDAENMSVSGESLSDEEKQSDTDDLNLEDEIKEEDFDEKGTDEMKTSEIENIDENKEENEANKENEENEEQNKEAMPSSSNANEENCLINEEFLGSNANTEALESNTDNNNSSNVKIEQNIEQHGSADALPGDNSTEGDGGKLQTSTILDQKEEIGQQFQPNNKDKSRRSLAENDDKTAKRQKVLENDDKQVNQNRNKNTVENQSINSNLYRHVESEVLANDKVYDLASNEEKQVQNEIDQNQNNDDIHFDKPEDIEFEEKDDSINEMKSIEVKSQKEKSSASNKANANNEEMESNEMEIEGEIVSTLTVKRGNESTFHTSLDLKDTTELNIVENWMEKRMDQISSAQWNKDLDLNSIISAWKECEAKVAPLVYELCEQLQLVLEPTKTAKMKGDYRNGKRLNMRKVIAYIASDFRKDKIWLRRTKPSKRQYQIVIAVDDSLSMADNQSKQLAFESLALLGKSLSLLEAGELAIMSFGEIVKLLHSFNEPFTDNTGAKLLNEVIIQSLCLIISRITNFSQSLTRL